MARSRVLVVGFSVVEETPGMVELVRELPGMRSRHEIVKVGLGGLEPRHLKYLFAGILNATAPQAVVFEIVSPGFRGGLHWRWRHAEALSWMLHCCRARGMRAGLLDLPRRDVVEAGDWAAALHRQIGRRHGLGYARVPLRCEQLRDVVHPNPAGQRRYATVLGRLIDRLDAPPPPRRAAAAPPRPAGQYRALRIGRLADPARPRRRFARGGQETEMVRLDPGAPLALEVPEGWAVSGLTYIVGPRSGRLDLEAGGRQQRVEVYDSWAYYARFGATEFAPLPGGRLQVALRPELPEVALRKGCRDEGPRIGYLGHLLLTRDPAAPGAGPRHEAARA